MAKTAILIDGSNLWSSVQTLDITPDYTKLMGLFGEITSAFYFTAIPPKTVTSSLRGLVDWLQHHGFMVISKDTKTFSNDGEVKMKGNMDVELCITALEVAEYVDRIVLFSGDGDFKALVEKLRKMGVRVIVASTSNVVADELKRSANEYIDLATIQRKFAKDEHPGNRASLGESVRETQQVLIKASASAYTFGRRKK